MLNEKIKRRESFRPFAPSVLKEEISGYFVQNDLAPFMEKVFEIKKDKKEKIPAVTHVDNSARFQTVSKSENMQFYNIIYSFFIVYLTFTITNQCRPVGELGQRHENL